MPFQSRGVRACRSPLSGSLWQMTQNGSAESWDYDFTCHLEAWCDFSGRHTPNPPVLGGFELHSEVGWMDEDSHVAKLAQKRSPHGTVWEFDAK